MNFGTWFGFLGGGGNYTNELPDIYPLGLRQTDFIRIDVVNIYVKILTDVIERSQGLSDEQQSLLWDSCLASETSDGLITRLAKAMYDETELFLVFDKTTKVLRKATGAEESLIRADYKKQAESKTGVYISFKNHHRNQMIKLYSALEYCTVEGLNKTMNVSKAVQIKINDLRSSIALNDKEEAKSQGKALAQSLKDGKDIMLDAKDVVETAKPDLSATNLSMELLNQKRAFYLGLPCSYITGELNSGLGDTGQADTKAIERGLKSYFVSIIKPVCKALLDKDLTFKSDDFQLLATGLEVLKTMELTSEEYMSAENKLRVVNKVFGFSEDTKGGPPPKDPVLPDPGKAVPPNVPDPNKPKPGGVN